MHNELCDLIFYGLIWKFHGYVTSEVLSIYSRLAFCCLLLI